MYTRAAVGPIEWRNRFCADGKTDRAITFQAVGPHGLRGCLDAAAGSATIPNEGRPTRFFWDARSHLWRNTPRVQGSWARRTWSGLMPGRLGRTSTSCPRFLSATAADDSAGSQHCRRSADQLRIFPLREWRHVRHNLLIRWLIHVIIRSSFLHHYYFYERFNYIQLIMINNISILPIHQQTISSTTTTDTLPPRLVLSSPYFHAISKYENLLPLHHLESPLPPSPMPTSLGCAHRASSQGRGRR